MTRRDILAVLAIVAAYGLFVYLHGRAVPWALGGVR